MAANFFRLAKTPRDKTPPNQNAPSKAFKDKTLSTDHQLSVISRIASEYALKY